MNKKQLLFRLEDTLLKLSHHRDLNDLEWIAYFSGYRNSLIHSLESLGMEKKEIIKELEKLGAWGLEGKIRKLMK